MEEKEDNDDKADEAELVAQRHRQQNGKCQPIRSLCFQSCSNKHHSVQAKGQAPAVALPETGGGGNGNVPETSSASNDNVPKTSDDGNDNAPKSGDDGNDVDDKMSVDGGGGKESL